jgi:hypothetical protein
MKSKAICPGFSFLSIEHKSGEECLGHQVEVFPGGEQVLYTPRVE